LFLGWLAHDINTHTVSIKIDVSYQYDQLDDKQYPIVSPDWGKILVHNQE